MPPGTPEMTVRRLQGIVLYFSKLLGNICTKKRNQPRIHVVIFEGAIQVGVALNVFYVCNALEISGISMSSV